MKKVILYDLDHTLFDPKTIKKEIFQPAFDTLTKTQYFTESTLIKLKNDFFSMSLNTFIEKYLNDESKEHFIKKLRSIDTLPTLKTYQDGYIVQELNMINYLVTSGLREYQNLKIDALGIRNWFTEIYIDDPIDPKWNDKEAIMRLIIKNNNYDISELLVIGDNPESELKAGNNIGIETIQILREGIKPSEIANFRINTLNELKTHI